RKLFPKVVIKDLRRFPCITDIEIPTKTKLIGLVEQMQEAQKHLHTANLKTDTDKKLAKQKVAILDKQIDKLVYELYGLTEEEIAIVENK
ncbi:hypothetical protein KAH27_10560, partial [bacterium]|nr:hypothetical protein [bacterium]